MTTRKVALIVFLSGLAASCGKQQAGPTRAGPPAGPRPDVTSCTHDADCTFGFGIDDSGCCLDENGKTAGAHTVVFDQWVAKRSASAECAKATCPPLASPIPPPTGACFNTARCRSGKCGDAC